jgi:hypothetical protein
VPPLITDEAPQAQASPVFARQSLLDDLPLGNVATPYSFQGEGQEAASNSLPTPNAAFVGSEQGNIHLAARPRTESQEAASNPPAQPPKAAFVGSAHENMQHGTFVPFLRRLPHASLLSQHRPTYHRDVGGTVSECSSCPQLRAGY